MLTEDQELVAASTIKDIKIVVRLFGIDYQLDYEYVWQISEARDVVPGEWLGKSQSS